MSEFYTSEFYNPLDLMEVTCPSCSRRIRLDVPHSCMKTIEDEMAGIAEDEHGDDYATFILRTSRGFRV